MSAKDGTGAAGRRRPNLRDGGVRKKRYTVMVSEGEDTQLRARAILADSTVPRLPVEAALAGASETPSERKELVVELYRLRRDVAGIATNMNQLAKFANTEKTFPAEAVRAVAEYRALVPRIQMIVDGLAGR